MNMTSARKVAEFVNLCDFDEKNRVVTALVPGHQSNWYNVPFERLTINNEKIIKVHCSNHETGEQCKGNLSSICYHCIAALIHAAGKKGFSLSFCSKQDKAEKLLRLDGCIVPIISALSQKKQWIVYTKKK